MRNPFKPAEIVDMTRSVGLRSYREAVSRGHLTVVTRNGYERADAVPHDDGTIEIRPCRR
jgi:hypothetical protein